MAKKKGKAGDWIPNNSGSAVSIEEYVESIGVEGFPDLSGIPKPDDGWNAQITKISELGSVRIAGVISPAIDIEKCKLVILIESDTTLEDVKQNWFKISEIRDKLSAAQGILSENRLKIYQTIYRMHNDFGMPYQKIAYALNFEIMVFICAGLRIVEEEVGKEDWRDYNLNLAKQYLVSSGEMEDDDSWMNEASRDLLERKAPWNLDKGPFSRQKIIDNCRAFKEKMKDGLVPNRKLDHILFFFIFNNNSRSYAADRLIKTFPGSSENNREFLHKWEIIRARIAKDLLVNMQQYFSTPATVGDFGRFFP